jgi:predicted esterase YcpF (UPF0227 family)
MYLIIHGFTSSSQSHKAQVFRRWLAEQDRESEWICPDLPIDPAAAMAILSKIIEQSDQPVKLVGSSLGGYYANILAARYALKAVLINPAVKAGERLKEAIGPHKNWHDDGVQEFTQAHVDALNAMDIPEPADPDAIFLMTEMGDETLDWRQGTAYYHECHQLVFRGGNHGFSRFKHVLNLIDQF